MLKVGLTGGVASGKSTIGEILKGLGTPVIDTDHISRRLMQPGQPAYLKTVAHFGPEIVLDNKQLDRSKLREIVFQSSAEKSWLEQMLHPLIREQAKRALQETSSADYAILIVPLMFETGFDELVDHVVAIDCPREVQVARLIQRDGITKVLAEKMIAAQMDNERRIYLADSVIHNSDNTDLSAAVNQLHQRLTELATAN